MTKIKTLKNRETGEQYAPRTHTKAVYDDNNNTLDSLLGVQDEKLSELGSKVLPFTILTKDEKVIEYHSYFRNLKIEVKESFESFIDLKSICLDLINKSSENRLSEIRWSAVVDGVRQYIFGKDILFEYEDVGDTHVEQYNEPLGLKICYDVEISNNDFPSSVNVHGVALPENPSLVVSESIISQETTKKTILFNNEFNKNKGFWMYIKEGANILELEPSANANYSYAKIEVLPGEKYHIVGYGNSKVYAWAIGDDNGDIILHSGYIENESQEAISDIEIPNNGKYLVVNKIKIKVTPIVEKRIDLSKDYLAGFDAKQSLKELTTKDVNSFFVNGGYYKLKEGKVAPEEITSYSTARALRIKVKEGMKAVGYAAGTGSVLSWAVIDSANNILIHSGYTLEWGELVDVSVLMPKGACYLIVNDFSAEKSAKISFVLNDYDDVIALCSSSQNKLDGKKILCLGDSITEFKDSNGLRYSDYMCRLTGCEIYNGGIGAAHMEQRANLTLEPSSSNVARAALDLPALVDAIVTGDWTYQDIAVAYLKDNANDDNTSIIERLKTIDVSEIDIVTIFIGTNDKDDTEGRLGIIGDLSPIQNSLGGFGYAIEKLLTANPNLKIYYFSPMPRYFETPSDNWDDSLWCDNFIGDGGMKFTNIVDKMIENAKHWRIPVCDMYRTLGINQFNIINYAPDGTHPSNGYEMIAKKIYSFIIANLI